MKIEIYEALIKELIRCGVDKNTATIICRMFNRDELIEELTSKIVGKDLDAGEILEMAIELTKYNNEEPEE